MAGGQMIKVGGRGARGRMGSKVSEAVTAAGDMTVAAEVDDGDAREPLTGCDVVVDFTHPSVVLGNLQWCAEHGLDTVVGTSGFDQARLGQVGEWLTGPNT